jgi:hypothetical protein
MSRLFRPLTYLGGLTIAAVAVACAESTTGSITAPSSRLAASAAEGSAGGNGITRVGLVCQIDGAMLYNVPAYPKPGFRAVAATGTQRNMAASGVETLRCEGDIPDDVVLEKTMVISDDKNPAGETCWMPLLGDPTGPNVAATQWNKVYNMNRRFVLTCTYNPRKS